MMVPSLYQKVEKLPWKQRRGSQHLNANADVFEILLQFLMLGKLPTATQLTSRQALELLKMTEHLDQKDTAQLVEHVKIFQEAMQPKRKSSSLFSRPRLSSSSFQVKKHPKRTPDDEKTFISKTTVTSTKDKEMDRFPTSGAEVTLSIITVTDDQSNLQVADSMDSTETCARTSFGDDPLLASVETTNLQCHHKDSTSSRNTFDHQHVLPLTANQKAVNPFDVYGLTPPGHPSDACSTDLPRARLQSSSLSHISSSSSSSSPSSSSSFSYCTSHSIRNIFQKRRTKEMSRIHAEWCASEYVM